MSGFADFGFVINRDDGVFNFSFHYQIDGYLDPETSEYFGDTTWAATYARDGGFFWVNEGAAEETWSGIWELGLLGDEGVSRFTLTFSATNPFTAETISSSWRIFSMAYSIQGRQVTGTSGDDIFIGGFGNDVLQGLAGNDLFDGGDGKDTLIGGDGDDRLNGALGNDRMVGGEGDDSYRVDAARDRVVEAADGGLDTVLADVSYKLSAEVERLLLKGSAAINGKGNAIVNSIEGNDAKNSLFGLEGNDTLDGGDGADRLFGGEGNDSLNGGAGIDLLVGGAGDDIYLVDTKADKVVEDEDGGIDTIRTVAGIAAYTLGENIETLETWSNTSFHGIGNDSANRILGGTGNDFLEGKGGRDLLEGGEGNDTLMGGAGADELRGGYGIDTASYADATSRIEASLATGDGTFGDADGDWLLGIDNLLGSNFNDVLTGSFRENELNGAGGDDTIAGGFGDDVIIGGAGADLLDGGGDTDVLSYAGSTSGVVVNLGTQSASNGDAEGDIISGFEHLTGGDGNDDLTGSAIDNILFGGGGDDSIHGGDGDDTIQGGTGSDWLDGEGGTNTVSYLRSTGGVTIDLYRVTVSGGDAEGDRIFSFDNAIGGNGNDLLSGHDGSNRLVGANGNDTIDAKGGNDLVHGGGGADILSGGSGIDTLSYARSTTWGVIVYLDTQTATSGDAQGDTISGFENAEGGELGDYLVGSAGFNWLSGRAGTDTLDGGAGDDVLVGGDQADTFLFSVGYGHDTIADFVAGSSSSDKIKLSYGSLFDSFSEVMAVAKTSGDDVVLEFGGSDRLLLSDVAIGSLTSDDFAFT